LSQKLQMTVLTDHIHTFGRRLASEGDTELGLTAKNLLGAIDHDSVLRQLPQPLTRAAAALTAGMPPSTWRDDREHVACGI